jgi:uncharacterized membrane protein YdjX (TVP38/TMEM64 family)
MSTKRAKQKSASYNKLLKNENNTNEDDKSKPSSPYKSLLLLALIFMFALSILYMIYLKFPNLEEEEKAWIKLPSSIEDAKHLGRVLHKYNHDHFYVVLAAYFSVYVFLQAFIIPGSIFLSILSGFLYPFPVALLLVCTCSALGATFCFFLSFIAARKLVLKYLHTRLIKFQQKIDSVRDDLFWYIVFLRITPLVPNWFMNLTSPLLNVPLIPFVLGTFVGVAPPSLIYIQAGTTLNTLANSSSVFSVKSVLALVIVSFLSLAPIALPKLFPKLFSKFATKLDDKIKQK